MNRSGQKYLDIKLLNVCERLSRPHSFFKINLFVELGRKHINVGLSSKLRVDL